MTTHAAFKLKLSLSAMVAAIGTIHPAGLEVSAGNDIQLTVAGIAVVLPVVAGGAIQIRQPCVLRMPRDVIARMREEHLVSRVAGLA